VLVATRAVVELDLGCRAASQPASPVAPAVRWRGGAGRRGSISNRTNSLLHAVRAETLKPRVNDRVRPRGELRDRRGASGCAGAGDALPDRWRTRPTSTTTSAPETWPMLFARCEIRASGIQRRDRIVSAGNMCRVSARPDHDKIGAEKLTIRERPTMRASSAVANAAQTSAATTRDYRREAVRIKSTYQSVISWLVGSPAVFHSGNPSSKRRAR
jgi:hypothetical protein